MRAIDTYSQHANESEGRGLERGIFLFCLFQNEQARVALFFFFCGIESN